MNPDEMNAAAQALVAATDQSAVASGVDVEARAAQLAPGLAVGSNAPGGYNYGRYVAPVVPALDATFVTAAKQEALRGAIRDATNAAQVTYDDAKAGYQARQRVFQQKQAERARQRQAEEDRRYSEAKAAQAQIAALQQRGAGYQVGGVDVAANASRPQMTYKNGKNGSGGYNFTDASGRAISAATYAKATGVNFAQLVAAMANSGDAGAKAAISGPGLNPKSASYRALTW